MARSEQIRTQRVQIRIAPTARRMLERVAALQNTTVSGFVVNRWAIGRTAGELGTSRKNLWERMRRLAIDAPT